MRFLDLILKKRDGGTHDETEIRFLIDAAVKAEAPDYQVTAWLMAVFYRGLTSAETGWLTQAMIDSGTSLDLSDIDGPKVDKHSTGGVGDKVSIILAPLAAAMGLIVPMMSGRGLGHTGGTLDKLAAIDGYKVHLAPAEAKTVLKQCGFVMMGQTATMVPADRLLYSLRDASGSVESIPLITASILSKKKAEGAQALVMDVKCGSGAFMNSLDDARSLAQSLALTGREIGLDVRPIITDMNEPLGTAVGNWLEIEESIAILRGDPASKNRRSSDLRDLTLETAARMALAGGAVASISDGLALARSRLDDGSAYERFQKNVGLQGGKPGWANAMGRRAPHRAELVADRTGFLAQIEAKACGLAAVALGAGRSRADEGVSALAGIELLVERGERVQTGQALAILWADEQSRLTEGLRILRSACRILEAPGTHQPVLIEEVTF